MNYSICIRTLGKGGEKYSRLLNSIKSLKSRPEEVIIVIPHGYSAPIEVLGYERVVYSEKGMLIQRIVGYESVKSEYVLLVDDDVEFEPDFINKLSAPIKKGLAEITFPIYQEMLPEKGIRTLIPALTLSAVPMIKKDMYTKVIASGGWSYYRVPNQYKKPIYAHSAPGTCMFARRQALIEADIRNELWVEIPSYPLWEDMVLFYKAWISGFKVMGIPDVGFEHLDAGATSFNRSVDASYASGINHIIFWYKFVFKQQKGIISNIINIAALSYWMVTSSLYKMLNGAFRGKKKELQAFIKGLNDGLTYIRN
ncbi:glycosyltransferase family 2 protein [Paenibacillus aceris]|uniref:GT2 family glycosyltransferase n=1 Tax=Paenibacillus aceris TaxID=869555 RepID=A0ABS4I7Z3_9BACL|nr:hypothetical protein [Paenibacillus aceris]MBP1967057.1 GT2 family glycosyltransferase [Paenibacillus aceris]NHW33254.1 hypothetical protein [Paenibacillus aceris]